MNQVAEKTPLVLVVDDDESMGALLQLQMERDGRTMTCHFDPDVLSAFKRCADRFRLIFETILE